MFVLYAVTDGWRHATYTTKGVLDGRLTEIEADADFSQASETLIAMTEAWCGATCQVQWQQADQPGWWTGEITLLTPRDRLGAN